VTAAALEAVTELAARQVLTSAATLLDTTYEASQVTSVDVTRTVLNAADQLLPRDRSAAYHLAVDALAVLSEYGAGRGEDPKALDRWTTVFHRTRMVAQMRAAANTTTTNGDQS